MKFRRLTITELQELESEFIQFLAANTVTGPDWQNLQATAPEKADHLLDVFSDIVFEKIIQGIQFLEYKTPHDIKTFSCQEELIIMNGLRVEGDNGLDLTLNLAAEEMMTRLRQAGAELQIYTAQKGYQPDRAAELFRMLEGGALISREGMLFKTIEELKQTNSLR
ncbi:MAG: hypothetical protein DA408_11815 [Bacteroidetes bacterium]|nr:MAG: hypothetical protein DA408_11815 [Bacteroidota bacterium]